MRRTPRPPDADLVIVGGGLGGLATAIAARQVGLSVLVLERQSGPSRVETGITLWSFAINVLRHLGLDPEGIGAPLERFVNFSAEGRRLSEVDLRPSSHEVGSASFDVHRGRLEAGLTGLLGAEAIRYSSPCIGVRQEEEAAVAVLTDGSEGKGRVLVGADGVHSAVRAEVAGDVQVRTSALGAWRGLLDLNEGTIPPGDHLRVYGPGGVFGAARLDERRVRWYAGGPLPAARAGTWSELAGHFGAWCEPVASIVEASRETGLLFNDTPRIRPLRRWVRGRVALVGDAAHAALPTLGVSGGLALADGVALASELARGVDDSVLDAYARRRQAIGRRVQRQAELVGAALMSRRPRIQSMRDRFLTQRFEWAQRRALAHLARGATASPPRARSTTSATITSVRTRYGRDRLW